VTTGDARSLLAPVSGLSFAADVAGAPNRIVIDEASRGQVFRGAGAAMTESSAVVLSGLPAAQRDEAMRRLFDPSAGIGLSMLRLPLGATDFSVGSWTYDDVAAGRTDAELLGFSTSRDDRQTRPLIRQAKALQPQLSVLATPWTAPAWMKTSGSLHGGSLRPEHTRAYARYLARSVREHRAAGVPVTALTLANEPQHDTPWYPSMALTAGQSLGIAAELPAALQTEGVTGSSSWVTTTTGTTPSTRRRCCATPSAAPPSVGWPSTATAANPPRNRSSRTPSPSTRSG
jgi:glucosylceramidase